MKHPKTTPRSGTAIKAATPRHGRHPLYHVMLPCLTAATLAISGACFAESMHSEISAYQGAKTCGECHDTSAREVMESLHYQMSGEPRAIDGWDKGKAVGMLTDFSPLYHTVASLDWISGIKQTGAGKREAINGCASCHAGFGAPPQKAGVVSEQDLANIDCLVCHAPDYRRTLVKETKTVVTGMKQKKKVQHEEVRFRIEPAPGTDTLKAARQARKPSTGMCLRCHGAVDRMHVRPAISDGENDVHFAMGMTCTECHTVKKHKIAGGADLRAQELHDTPVGCPNCHTEKPHKGKDGALLNKHCYRIACQTCHIPAIARTTDMPAATDIDWSTPVRNATTGLFEPAIKRTNGLKPEYAWWNRVMSPAGEPQGGKRDRTSRVYPWQRVACTVIIDATTGTPLPMHAGTYAATGDIEAAIRKGAAELRQPYGGTWKTARQTVLLSVNHQVAPKTEALKCDDCHGENGKAALKALGYGR